MDTCFSFIHGHTARDKDSARHVRRAVTISRQAGCGAKIIANQLAHQLQERAPHVGLQWTVFDRQLMEKVLADHNLPKYLADFLPEDRISAIEDTMADIFGVRPPTEKMVQQTAETLLQLAELGEAILIGRGGNIVTAKLPNVLHVRLVAAMDDRVERLCHDEHKTPDNARRFCLEEDQARARYLKTYFHADINDPLRYHLVINTSLVGCENAARIMTDAVLRLGPQLD